MAKRLLTKDFNFIGLGIINISVIGTDTTLALQPFMVSKTKDGVYEAVALNFGIVAPGITENEAIRNMSLGIFNYSVSFIRSKAPIETVSRAEYMSDFFMEYARLSIKQNKSMQAMLNFFYQTENIGSYNADGNYYRVA